jgi:UDP-N-acetylmuramoyl-tripeptide--D-alanyl-D-alanine ligase
VICFCFKGDNFNGNKFALPALEKGAAYSIVDEVIQVLMTHTVVEDVLAHCRN